MAQHAGDGLANHRCRVSGQIHVEVGSGGSAELDGSFPIRSFVLFEGKRFPLGVASAGLAILSFLPEAARQGYLQRVDLQEAHGPEHAPGLLRERMNATRAAGYSVNPGLVVEGSWGMGAAVFDAAGQPAWAVSFRRGRRPTPPVGCRRR